MNRTSHSRATAWQTLAWLLLPVVTLVVPLVAHAAAGDAAAQQRHRSESAACASKADAETRRTCLKEAGAAQDEAGRDGLRTPQADLSRNAKLRCDALPGDQKASCLARMSGAGVTSGSVEGGGVLRELRVSTPTAATSTSGAASAAAADGVASGSAGVAAKP